MKVEINENWEEADLPVIINMNFTDVREAVEFWPQGAEEATANLTLSNGDASTWNTGDNDVFNITETREFEFVINGKGMTKGEDKDLLIKGI